ncbi:outer membrane beta-barrel protein [Agaribacterium haliotis]|uniref:outer membrane beta-barrel protein n=1 Tax=Agaribacterium haliotis TaxID=2013869 RepID=UPI000BB56E90|nr:outer membrane beta-barrel protein [Agaribacterium haliotis]
MKNIKIFASSVALFLPLSVWADGVNLGLGFHKGSYKEDQVSDVNTTGLMFSLGKNFNKNIGLEGRFIVGKGTDEGDLKVPNLFGTGTHNERVELGLEYLSSLMLKGDLGLGKNSSLYGMAGCSNVSLNASFPNQNYDFSDSSSGLSYGVGAWVGDRDSFTVNIEYVSYVKSSDYDYSALELSLRFIK